MGEPRARATEPVGAGTDTRAVGAPSRRRIVMRVLLLVVTGFAFYLVLPGLIVMFGSLPQLEGVFPLWFVPIFVLEALAFCVHVGADAHRAARRRLVRRRVRTAHRQRVEPRASRWCRDGRHHHVPDAHPLGVRRRDHEHRVDRGRSAVDRDVVRAASARAPGDAASGSRSSSELLQGAILGGVLGIFLLTGASILLVSDRVVRAVGRVFDWFVHRVLRRPAAGAEHGPAPRRVAQLRPHRVGGVVEARGARRARQPAVRLPRPLREPARGRLDGSTRCSCCSRSSLGARWR